MNTTVATRRTYTIFEIRTILVGCGGRGVSSSDCSGAFRITADGAPAIYLAEVCAANVLTAYVDGLPIGSQAGCSPGNATTYGLQFGQNNNQVGGDQWMTGAIDGIRMWTTARSPTQICEAAGRTGC